MKKHIKKINFSKFKHVKSIKFGVVVLVFVLFFSFYNNFAKSSTLDNLTGGAWGMDEGNFGYGTVRGGMEWLSFNCTTHNGCSDSNYGVNYDLNTGYLTGYAYSAHYGWVKFGDLNTSEMPTGFGTYTQNAQVVGGEVRGWARFCAPAANPSLCTGNAGKNASNGGWDGWLSLRGTGYGVTYDSATKNFGGYAWGGNEGVGTHVEQVVGWVDFSNVSYAPVNLPTVTISAQDISIPEGGQTTIYWDGLNLINAPDGCKTDGSSVNTGAWLSPNTKNSPSGTFNTGVLNTKGDYVYQIQCKHVDFAQTGLWSNIASVTVHVGIRLFLSPDSFVSYYPFNVDLTWYSDQDLTNCSAKVIDSFGNVQTDWKIPPPVFESHIAPQTKYDYSIANMSAPVEFRLRCFDGAVPVDAQPVFVNKGYNEQLTFSNTKVVNNKTTLKWTVVGMQANSCVPDSNPSNPSWQTPTTKTSTPDGSYEEADIDVPGPGNNKFTMTCTGNSNQTYSVTLDINQNSGKQSRKYKEN